jgi:murein DD-endopeptidase MepM/ murein hydrolase activator NlpD
MREISLRKLVEIGLALAAVALPAVSAGSGRDRDCDDGLCIEVERRDDGAAFFALNPLDAPATIEFGFPTFENMNSSRSFPLRTVVHPHSRQSLLTIRSVESSRATRWRWQWSWTTGVLHADHDDSVRYRVPWSSPQHFKVGQAVGGSFTHTGKARFAFDFRMPVGTTVRAARDGTVVRVVEHFDAGGTEERFKKRANAIFILHADGTIARYLHLQHQGALVETGDPVQAGDPIGLSGNTGYSQKPHLHFDVFTVDDELGRQTIDVRFANGSYEGFVPRTGQSLYGGDGGAFVLR